MRLTRTTTLAGITAAAALVLAGCGSDNGATQSTQAGGSGSVDCATGSISGQGSTFQQNIEQQWVTDFGGKCSGAQVNYQGTGSGAGIEQFGSGTVDFAGSDVVMKSEEQQKADSRCNGKAIHVPITAGGIAIIYNLKGVDNLQLSAKTLAGIFQGTIKKWDDPQIKAENAGATLPSTAISAYHRADGSGTTSVFSQFLDADAAGVWKLGTGKTLNWTGGQAAKGSDGVTAGVKQTDGGITYAEVSYAKANNLSTAKVAGTGTDYVELTGANVSKAIDSGFTVTGSGNDVAGKVDFTKVQGYPISTVSYAIVCQKYTDAAKAKLIKAYFTYAVTSGQSQAEELGYAPLASSVADKAKAAIATVA